MMETKNLVISQEIGNRSLKIDQIVTSTSYIIQEYCK